MAVASSMRPVVNPHQQLEWTIAAQFSVAKASPVVLREMFHSAFLCVEVGNNSHTELWWPLMWLLSCLQSLVLLPP